MEIRTRRKRRRKREKKREAMSFTGCGAGLARAKTAFAFPRSLLALGRIERWRHLVGGWEEEEKREPKTVPFFFFSLSFLPASKE
jgi:hypothetical protein